MTNYEKLAPIVIFVYNRPLHTKKTIDALRKNLLAKESELFIYSDAPRNFAAEESVKEVRGVIRNVQGFKKVTIVEREKNWGLANSIVDGVTSIVNKYGKIIVLEDDIVTSPYFLKFMNDALNFYDNNKKVWHISGWNYPIEKEDLEDAFFFRVMNCWGWGTWCDRWIHYEKNPKKIKNNWSADEKFKFDLDGSGIFWGQVEDNLKGKINTWAIFWYATIFNNHGLCLNPTIGYCNNIGFDGSGVHCGPNDALENLPLNTKEKILFPVDVVENEIAVDKIRNFLKNNKKSIFIKIFNRISQKIKKIKL